jgi:hypothetical protein
MKIQPKKYSKRTPEPSVMVSYKMKAYEKEAIKDTAQFHGSSEIEVVRAGLRSLPGYSAYLNARKEAYARNHNYTEAEESAISKDINHT